MKPHDLKPSQARQESDCRLPARTEPMMLTHLALTGNVEQYVEWRDRVERVRQAEAVDRAADPETKSLLASRPAWDQMRETGTLGAMAGLGMAAMWLAGLMNYFATVEGIGWLASCVYLLPLPIAWSVSRRLWERAALQGMKDHVGQLTLRKCVRGFVRSLAWSFGAGFGFGFTLLLIQALISWFITPYGNIMGELGLALAYAVGAGTITGMMGTIMSPVIARPAPEPDAGLPIPALPEPDADHQPL